MSDYRQKADELLNRFEWEDRTDENWETSVALAATALRDAYNAGLLAAKEAVDAVAEIPGKHPGEQHAVYACSDAIVRLLEREEG